MNFHSMSVADTIRHVTLNKQRATGKNQISSAKKKSIFSRFFAQFSDFMILVLLVAAGLSFFISIVEGEKDFIDPIIILLIVILNAVIGVVIESRADNALESLKQLTAPTAKIRRGNKELTISTEDVKIGDTLLLRAGDRVSADARITKSIGLEADESALTGEAMPVPKDGNCVLDEYTPLADRKNMVFSSTNIIGGRGEAIVTAIGMETETGKIAALLGTENEEATPLQKKLAETGKVLSIGALLICAVIFAMGIIKKIPPFSMFLTSVSLAVAAIPEGLPAIVTVVLAMGVKRMTKKNAIVKRLAAVESLGGATVICADKTGTLTQNRMTVTKTMAEDERQLFELAILCCDEGENPTEQAIISKCKEMGIIRQEGKRVCEIPFDSDRKLMSVMVPYFGENRIITKGAAEILLKKCSHRVSKGEIKELDGKEMRRILSEVERMANNALRVIAVAYRDTKLSVINEKDLIFVGLIGMMDPPRPEVRGAVSECIRAGIKPVMITGDNKITARAIAKTVGISGEAIQGEEISGKSDEEICKYRIFARVTPKDKMRIVKAFKKQGEIVAMTGDGVNDAPALKAADIGCSMGKRGTEVAKEASALVLADDNFATIVSAVREGRGIFQNIKKSIQFLLSSNIGEVMTIFMGMVFGWEPPLVAIQLLWVNLVTDSLPAIALGLDPVETDIMDRAPRDPKKGLFADGLWTAICLEGGLIGGLALFAYSIGFNVISYQNIDIARTMAFCVLSMSQLFHAFNMRSDRSVLNRQFIENKTLVFSLIIGVIMQITVVTVPVLAEVFKVCPLSITEWLIVVLLSAMPLLVVEIEKKFTAK